MNSYAIIASLLLTFVANGSTTVRFDGRNSGYSHGDLNGRQPLNEDSGLTFSQELTYDHSNLDADSEFNYNGAIECVPGTPQCKILTVAKSDRDAEKRPSDSNENGFGNDDDDDDDGRFEGNGDYRSYGQSGRSVESYGSGEESAVPREESDAAAFGPATLGWAMVRRMAAVDRVVAEEHRCNGVAGNLLDVDAALPVKKSAVKVTRRDYVSFRHAEVADMKTGRLEYLSVDAAKDTVYVECAFDRLVATGAFKTNLRHTKAGRFVVDMERVLSNVTASFHKGRATIGPAATAAFATRVTATDHRDAGVVEEAVDKRYRGVLGRAVSAEVYNSTHKGMVARLKAETRAPFGDASRAAVPFDVDWTEGELNVRAFAAGGGDDDGSFRRRRAAPRKIESVSYTRAQEDAYRMRFDVDLDALSWTGDLTGTWKGRSFRAPATGFELDRVKVHVAVVKSTADGRTCRKVETYVRARGFRYAFNERSPAPDDVQRAVERELFGFVKRSFEAQLRNSVKREMCDGPVDSSNSSLQ